MLCESAWRVETEPGSEPSNGPFGRLQGASGIPQDTRIRNRSHTSQMEAVIDCPLGVRNRSFCNADVIPFEWTRRTRLFDLD